MSREQTPRAVPSAQAQPVRILSVHHDQPVAVRFLGPLLGLNTHWHSGRSIPCPGPADCPASIHRTRTVYKAYAPVESWDGACKVWRPSVLEATEHLEETLRGRQLRGQVWILSRASERGKTDPVIGIFCEELAESAVSKPFDIVPVLLRFFHVSTLNLGVANPLPPKLVLEAVAGAPPNLPQDLLPVEPVEPTAEERAKLREQLQKMRGKTSSNGSPPPSPANETNGKRPERSTDNGHHR